MIPNQFHDSSDPNHSDRIVGELLAIAALCPGSPFIELITNSKRPKGKSWTSIAIADLARALQTGGIALVFEGNSLCAFDSDGPESRQPYYEIFNEYPEETATASWTSGKPDRLQLLFKYPEPSTLPEHLQEFVQKRQVIGKNELDYRSGHNYSVLPTFSNHPDTGKPYYWLKRPREVGIKELTVEQLQRLYQLANTKNQNKKSADKETKAQRKAFVAELVRKYSERKAEFNNGNLTISDLSPSEYFDWIVVPKAGWRAAIGYGSTIGFKKKGKHWYTAPGYRHSESGLSVGIEWHQLKDGSFIYRVTDWLYQNSEQRGYFTGIDFILMRRGISEPKFSERVALVQEMAGAFGLPCYEPTLTSDSFTKEQRQEYRHQKFLEAIGEYLENRQYPETALVMKAASIEEAIAIIWGAPQRVVAVKGVKGCGKSDIVKAFDGRLSVATTRSLSYDQAKKYGLSNYQTRKSARQLYEMGETRVLDSLHKLPWEEPDYTPDTLVLDEWDSILHQINTSATDVAKHRPETRAALADYAKEAGRVIALSADMNGDEVRALEGISQSKVLVIKLTIPPQGNILVPVKNLECGLQLLLQEINAIGREWIDNGRMGSPRPVTVASDSRRISSLVAASISHKNTVVIKHGDEGDLEAWASMTAELVERLDPDVQEIVKPLLVTAETVTEPEVKTFLSDPALWIQQVGVEGKIAIPAFSPSVREGVSILLPDCPHNHYAFLHGEVLDTRGKAQLLKRDRNPGRTYLVPCSSTFTRQSNAIVQTRDAIKQELLSRQEFVNGDRDFVERVKAEANYHRFREAYYRATGSSVDKATKSEIHLNIAAISEREPDYFTTEMISDFLEIQGNESPWLSYAIAREQERQLAFTNEMQNLIDHMVAEDGFTVEEMIEFEPEKDDNTGILEQANDAIQAKWMQEGHSDHEALGSEESIRDSLSCDRGINQKEKRILEGGLIPKEFPGVSLEHPDFVEQVKNGNVTRAGKRLAELKNPGFLKHQLAKRTANRINKGVEQAIVTDDDEARKRYALHQILGMTTYWDFLNTPAIGNRELGYFCETPELIEFVDSCRKHQRSFKKVGLTVPPKGHYDQYVQFLGRVHARMGLNQRAARGKRLRHLSEGDTLFARAYYVPGLARAFTMCEAYETYLAGKETFETRRVARTRRVKQFIEEVQHSGSSFMNKSSAAQPQPQAQQVIERQPEPSQLSLLDQAAPSPPDPVLPTIPSAPAPEGAPKNWATGTALKVIAWASDLRDQEVTLVEWLHHKDFGMWSVLVMTWWGKQVRISPNWVALA